MAGALVAPPPDPPTAPPPVSTLFLEFVRLGATGFGGPAIIAHIQELAVERRRWLNARTVDDGIALCQSLPGATAMQVAAYVGLRTRGPLGAVASYAGLGLPAFVMMMVLSAWYARARAMPSVVALLGGLNVIMVSFVAHAAFRFGRELARSAGAVVLVATSILLHTLHLNPLAVIATSFVGGLALFRPGELVTTSGTCAPERLRFGHWASLLAIAVAGLVAVRRVDPRLFDLSTLMLRVNMVAFGAALSSLPLMFHEVVDARGWLDARTFMDGIALGQVTPGPISITATFIGYRLSGCFGAFVATLAMFTPPLLVLLAAAPHFDRIRSSTWYLRASRGLAAGFVGLLVVVTIRFAQDVPWTPGRVLLGAGVLVGLFCKLGMGRLVVVAVGVSLLLK
jgi:chromate transporter